MCFCDVGQRAAEDGEDRLLGILEIVLLERGADRLDAAARALGQPAGDLRLHGAAGGQFAGMVDELGPLLVGELAEARAALDALGVVAHEAVDARTQEAHALAAVEHEPAADEAQGPPPRNGLGRDVELPGELFDGEDLLAHGVGRELGGVGQIFDQQAQVVHQIAAGDFALGGASARRRWSRCSSTWPRLVVLVDVDAGDESLGGVDAREKLLARERPVGGRAVVVPRDFVINVHGPPLLSIPFLRRARGVPCDSFAHGSSGLV